MLSRTHDDGYVMHNKAVKDDDGRCALSREFIKK